MCVHVIRYGVELKETWYEQLNANDKALEAYERRRLAVGLDNPQGDIRARATRPWGAWAPSPANQDTLITLNS